MENIREISRKEEKIVKVLTEFTFKDNSKKEVEVTFFEPKDDADIQKGLENRLISEQRSVDELKAIAEAEE